MYPRINDLVKILHGHEISTFLVTNAQFPDAIRLVKDIHGNKGVTYRHKRDH